MADNFSASLGLQWSPPAAPVNSGNSTLGVVGTENAQQIGKIDVPNGTVVGTVFPIAFGTVGAAKICAVQNLMSSEIGVRLNGAIANNFTLGPGQIFALMGPTAGSTTPLISVSIVTTADPASIERVFSWVLGD